MSMDKGKKVDKVFFYFKKTIIYFLIFNMKLEI